MQVTLYEYTTSNTSRSDRNLIRHLIEFYQYDFSEFDGQNLDEHGCFGYGDLDYFWFEPTHSVFLITVDEKLAGFVLIDNEVVVTGSERSVTKFFINRSTEIHSQAGTYKMSELMPVHTIWFALRVEIIIKSDPTVLWVIDHLHPRRCCNPNQLSGLSHVHDKKGRNINPALFLFNLIFLVISAGMFERRSR